MNDRMNEFYIKTCIMGNKALGTMHAGKCKARPYELFSRGP